MDPYISVIIPNYCHSKYLEQRIQSVLDQTFQDFELIILDDCSPDEGASRSVIEKYRNNPHVSHIVYNEKNSGSTFKQWQKGFELSKGEYIWIAESDDFCTNDMLQKLVECLNKHPDSSIVQSTSCYVDSEGKPLAPDWKPKGGVKYLDGISFIKKHLVCSNLMIPNASAVIFRKDYAKSVPIDYMDYKASGDRLFWIYMCEKGGVCTLDEQLNFFRQHNKKVSPQKETDGTQCKENYRINLYLRNKGYITRFVKMEEYTFYWHYIHSFQFSGENVRNELLNLWFRNTSFPLTYQIFSFILYIHSMYIRILRKMGIANG